MTQIEAASSGCARVRPRAHAARATLLATCVAVLAASHAGAPEPVRASRPAPPAVRPVLSDHLLITWYGNPRTPRMGVLGRHKGAALAAGLRKQADAYARLTTKKTLAAYHLVAVIAQPTAWRDGAWRRRETHETIRALLEQARANDFKLILDVQRGRSTIQAELEYLRPHLQEPDVYLALDPEFAMRGRETPGRTIGRMTAAEVNEAIDFLETIVGERKLPPKVLIVHQFTLSMLADKENIRDSPLVDVVLSIDGFGDRPLKRATYAAVIRQRPLEFLGIKLFYSEDTNLFAAKDVMALRPEPAVIIYQ
jgi:hypothetical protein